MQGLAAMRLDTPCVPFCTGYFIGTAGAIMSQLTSDLVYVLVVSPVSNHVSRKSMLTGLLQTERLSSKW